MEYSAFSKKQSCSFNSKKKIKKENSLQPLLTLSYSKKELGCKVFCFEIGLTNWLDNNAKNTKVTTFSKI